MTGQTVFLLGAGASAAASEPKVVTDKLLELALSVAWDSPLERIAQERVLVLLRRLRVSDKAPYPSVDDILTLCDWATSRSISLSHEHGPIALRSVRDDIHILIHATITKYLHDPYKERGALGPIGTLVDYLTARRDHRHALISLNWDCLVELSEMAHSRADEPLIDYGFPWISPFDGKHNPRIGGLQLLKPHGSLSWLHCPLCQVTYSTIHAPNVLSAAAECPRCKSPLGAVLVPPSTLPSHLPTVLVGVGAAVEQAIAGAERLIVCGYSLPPQDVDIRAYLIRGLATRKGLPRLKVTVVNLYDPANPYLHSVESGRYRSLLGPNAEVEAERFVGGIAEWLDKGGLSGVAG